MPFNARERKKRKDCFVCPVPVFFSFFFLTSSLRMFLPSIPLLTLFDPKQDVSLFFYALYPPSPPRNSPSATVSPRF
ncbi:hypothetical protein BDV59DRAFT_26014 [Aspergillus ambiguus]|uniref:uncharacterized protein n=1 Tax=Aspergillus ambiguus TaxID=176160 RepID=UPI003CCDAD42